MKENVHLKGQLYNVPDLILHIIAKKISPKQYFKYLEKKYSELY